MSKNTIFLGSEIENRRPDKARFHIIPAPLEQTVSYGKGTARGPEALIEASDQLETIALGKEPAAFGIHTQKAVAAKLNHEEFLKQLERQTRSALEAGALPVVVGGEHSLTYAPYKACRDFYGEEIGLIQFDAHCDLRKDYLGNPLSHASVMRRLHEEFRIPLYQLGTRAYCTEEKEYRETNKIYYEDAFHLQKDDHHLVLPRKFPEKIYLSFDIDALDSSLMPATGTPVPGGLSWYRALSLLEDIIHHRTVVGMDLVELAPRAGFPHCDFTAAQLLYNMMALTLHGTKLPE